MTDSELDKEESPQKIRDNNICQKSRCHAAIIYYLFACLSAFHSEVSLRSLSKGSLKRSDKKSGRKRPRKNDVDISVTPAPDSLHEEMKKTPKSKKKLRFLSPVEEYPFRHQSTELHRHHPSSSNRPRHLQKLLKLRKKIS